MCAPHPSHLHFHHCSTQQSIPPSKTVFYPALTKTDIESREGFLRQRPALFCLLDWILYTFQPLVKVWEGKYRLEAITNPVLMTTNC